MKAVSLVVLLSAAAAAAEAPAAGAKPRLAVVIDDFGLDHADTPPEAEWWALTFPYTAAVMPESPRTKEAAEGAAKAGKPVILHFPFDPFLSLKLPAGSVDKGDQEKVEKLFTKALAQVPGAAGLNNHRSLHATMNRPLMAWFMGRVKAKGLFFLDSRVSGKTVAHAEAKRAGVRTAINEFFLDEGPKSGEAFCLKWLDAGARVARKRGSAVVIGHHYFRGTLDCLRKRVPELQKKGVELVPVSTLME